jgi:hypothetical protein
VHGNYYRFGAFLIVFYLEDTRMGENMKIHDLEIGMKRFALAILVTLTFTMTAQAAGVGALMKTGAEGVTELVQVISRRAGISAADSGLLTQSIRTILRSFNGGSLDNISDSVLREAFGNADVLGKDAAEVDISAFFSMYEQGVRKAETLISITDNQMVSTCFSSCMGSSLREHTSLILKNVPTSQNFRNAIQEVGGTISGNDLIPELQEALTKNFDFSTRDVRRFVRSIDGNNRATLLNALDFMNQGSDAQKGLGREFASLPSAVKQYLLTSDDRVMLLAATNGADQAEMDESARAVTMLIRAAKSNTEELSTPEDFQRGLRAFYESNAEENEDTLRLLREKDCFGQGKYLPVL